MQKSGTTWMTLTAAALLCGAALALPAMAQQDAPPPPPQGQQGQWGGPGGPGGGGRGNPARRLEMLQHRLNLTPDQTTQVKAILDDGRAKAEAQRNDQTGDRREKMRAMMEEENGRIMGVLTPDQKKIYMDMQKEQRDRMRERREDGSGPGGNNAPPPPPPPPGA